MFTLLRKMLPPKKNQAAREEPVEKDDEQEANKSDDEVNEETAKQDKKAEASKAGKDSKKGYKGWTEVDSDEEDFQKKNIFQETIIGGKRKHFVNRHDEVLKNWLSDNFVEKEGKRCAFSQCYVAYLDLCTNENINTAMEEHAFVKILKKEFPNGFGLTEGSKYKDEIREHKKSDKSSEVKADTLKLKLKDVVNQAFQGLNNPAEGIMFNTLKKYMIVKFPALQLDEKPHVLLRGLQNGVYYGYVELLRGVGKAGKYRWYDPDRKEEEKPSKKKKVKSESDADKGDKTETGESAESADSGKEESGEDKKDSADNKDSDDKSAEEKKPAKKQAPKRKRPAAKKKGKTAPKKRPRKFIVHSDPQRIEDTFPLAFTFMAEPKETSGKKCLAYIEKFYDVEMKPEKFQKHLEKGVEKGYWAIERGSGMNAVYQLTVESFDPSDDDDMIGKIINAIMANTEPKSSSAKGLKDYLIEFYSDFKVADKPNLYKRALERACNKDLIRQISGIGATGTFELVESFVPSPSILAGKDTAEDYEESDTSSDDSSGDEGISDSQEIDLTIFQDAYKPRPSKRRGKAREVTKSGGFDKNAAYVEALKKQMVKRKSSAKSKSKPKSTLKVPRKKRQESSDEESDEDSSSDEEEEEEDSEVEVDSTYGSDAERYKPRPTQSRGGSGARGRAPPPTKASVKMRPPPSKGRGRPAKRARSPSPEPAPPKKTAKGRKPPAKRNASPPPAKKGKAAPAAKGKAAAAKAAPKKAAAKKRRR